MLMFCIEDSCPVFKAKPFMIISRTDQEGNDEAHRISQ